MKKVDNNILEILERFLSEKRVITSDLHILIGVEKTNEILGLIYRKDSIDVMLDNVFFIKLIDFIHEVEYNRIPYRKIKLNGLYYMTIGDEFRKKALKYMNHNVLDRLLKEDNFDIESFKGDFINFISIHIFNIINNNIKNKEKYMSL